MNEKLICENPKCKRPFIKTWYTQRYCCESCRKAVRQMRAAEERKSAKQEIINKHGAKPRLSLTEANALARAEGLTYGQYYNKHGYDGWF